MIELNLIPDVKRELLRARMMRNAVTAMSVTIGLISIGALVVLGIVLGGQIALERLHDGTIKQRSQELIAVEDLNKTVTIQHQMAKINELASQRKMNSRLLDVISAINPPAPNTIRLTSLKLNPSELSISIDGLAENGYAALEVFKKTITHTKLQVKTEGGDQEYALADNLRSSDASFGEDAAGKKVLRFSFTFNYPQELFAAASGTVLVVTPSGKVDVTDSKLGVPDSLFGSGASDDKKKEAEHAG